VAWITERKERADGLFSFCLTLLGWIAFIDKRTRRPIDLLLPGADFFMCWRSRRKQPACTLPAALFLILWFAEKKADHNAPSDANCSFCSSSA